MSHSGGLGPNGLVVCEVWESKDAQARFMNDRLMAALQEGGITAPPSRADWIELAGYVVPS